MAGSIMKLFENEKILIESDTKEFVLTTHRIQQGIKVTGGKQFKSIMLQELDSCSLKFKTNPIFLIIAAIALVLGVAALNRGGIGAVLILLAVIMTAIYFFSRKTVTSFHANKESLIINCKNVGYEKSKELIDQVEAAKYSLVL